MIDCCEHGKQDETFVCQHIVESLRTKIPCGFWWAKDSKSSRPDAWCSACNKLWGEKGAKWSKKVEDVLGIKLLCGACYDVAKSLNL